MFIKGGFIPRIISLHSRYQQHITWLPLDLPSLVPGQLRV